MKAEWLVESPTGQISSFAQKTTSASAGQAARRSYRSWSPPTSEISTMSPTLGGSSALGSGACHRGRGSCAWAQCPREGFDDLLGRPGRAGEFRDVEMNNATPVVAQHQEGEEYAEGGGRHGEEIDRGQRAEMVVRERCARSATEACAPAWA